MFTVITDGEGKGVNAGITSGQRLKTSAVTVSREHNANHDLQKAYQVVLNVTNTGADDCFFYIKNSNDENLIVEGLKLSVSKACGIYHKINDVGTPVGGTDLTPVNLHAGSNNEADGTFQKGVDITGLSGGTEFERNIYRAATNTDTVNFEQDLVLPKNKTYSIYSSVAGVEIDATVIFNYHSMHGE